MNPLNKLACSSGLVLVLLAGCGGGDDAGTSPVMRGVAAVGTPIVGATVSISCAGGGPLTTTTVANGAWQATTSGQTLPCAVRVSGGSVGGSPNSTPYHSIAINFGNVNITPLTDLVVANLSGKSPAAWFGALHASNLQAISAGQVSTAVSVVTNALGMATTLAGNDALTTVFVAAKGNLLDDVLEALAAAGANHQALLAMAVNKGFVAPNGFDFSAAYAAVLGSTSGGSTGGGTTGGGSTGGGSTGGGTTGGGSTGGGSAGSGNLRVAVTVAGQTSVIDVAGVAAPSTQAEFCSALTTDPTFTNIGSSGGGSLTITGCSFSGKVGTIGANLTVQGFNVPYTMTYTYL